MGVAAGEGMQLVLDRRTVSRPDSLYLSRKQRRLVEPALKNRVYCFVCMDYEAVALPAGTLNRRE